MTAGQKVKNSNKYFLPVFLLSIFLAYPIAPALCRVSLPQSPLLKVEDPPWIEDNLDPESFHESVKRQLSVWKHKKSSDFKTTIAQFPDREVTLSDFVKTLEALDYYLQNVSHQRIFNQILRENFDFYQMAGKKGKGDVFLTAYFHPLIKGSLKKSKKYPYPLYRKPKDLIAVDLSSFRNDLKNIKIKGRLENQKFVPYFNRYQIDFENKLKNKGLEIAYVSSLLDQFFLQIQGSGTLILPNGKRFPVNYEGSNGRKYVSIGRELITDDFLGRKELSMQSIRELLENDQELLHHYLNLNPSYVFFQKGHSGPKGSGGATLTTRRSLATDRRLFPQGTPVFVKHRIPSFDDQGKIKDWHDASLFMINQDTGGAIRGPGRADLYLGEGDWAELTAGNISRKHFSLWKRLFHLA